MPNKPINFDRQNALVNLKREIIDLYNSKNFIRAAEGAELFLKELSDTEKKHSELMNLSYVMVLANIHIYMEKYDEARELLLLHNLSEKSYLQVSKNPTHNFEREWVDYGIFQFPSGKHIKTKNTQPEFSYQINYAKLQLRLNYIKLFYYKKETKKADQLLRAFFKEIKEIHELNIPNINQLDLLVDDNIKKYSQIILLNKYSVENKGGERVNFTKEELKVYFDKSESELLTEIGKQLSTEDKNEFARLWTLALPYRSADQTLLLPPTNNKNENLIFGKILMESLSLKLYKTLCDSKNQLGKMFLTADIIATLVVDLLWEIGIVIKKTIGSIAAYILLVGVNRFCIKNKKLITF